MCAARRINKLIFSLWIFNILLVEGKKYPCVLKEKLPPEEFESKHFGELGFLRNVIIDVAGFLHTQMQLETPLRLCKLLSDVKTSYWDYLRVGWKKKTREKYGTEFNYLEKKAERVLDDLIKDARLTPEFPVEDQDALANIIDLAKDRLLNSKTYTNQDGIILSYLNKLRSTYCPKIAGTFPISKMPPGPQTDNQTVNRYAKPAFSVPMKTMAAVDPTATVQSVLKAPATQNVLSDLAPTIAAAGLPKSPLSQESDKGSAPKPDAPPEPKKYLFSTDWHKSMPQQKQAVPALERAASKPSNGKECAPEKGCRPIRVNAITGEYLGEANVPTGMVAADPSAASQNHAHTPVAYKDHEHRPVYPGAQPGATSNGQMTAPKAQLSPASSFKPQDNFYFNPDVMRNYGMKEEDIQKQLAAQKARADALTAAVAAENAAPQAYSAPSRANVNTQPKLQSRPPIPKGAVSSADLMSQSISLPGPESYPEPDYRALTAWNPIYELRNPKEFPIKVLQADKIVFVQFHASWCGPCRTMTPILKGLIEKKQGGLYWVRVDFDNFGALCKEYEIEALPQLRVFQDGSIVDKQSGNLGAAELTKLVNKHCLEPFLQPPE